MAETLEVMECPERKKDKLVIFFLTSDAKDWWESLAHVLGPPRFTWETFDKAFQEEYFPQTFQHSLWQNFMIL